MIIGTLNRAKPLASNLTQSEWRAIKSFQRDDADKGKATMVLDKENYNEKMMSMLSDKSTSKDPSSSLERKMNEKLFSLKMTGT